MGIVDWEVLTIILFGGLAIAGVAYLLDQYRRLRDRDWI
jgi:hypothetical protein